jgi:hypothetical protein
VGWGPAPRRRTFRWLTLPIRMAFALGILIAIAGLVSLNR